MKLINQSNHPSARSYVLKLHRDAKPHLGDVFGRLENMLSGQQFDFHSGAQLLACLAIDTAAGEAEEIVLVANLETSIS